MTNRRRLRPSRTGESLRRDWRLWGKGEPPDSRIGNYIYRESNKWDTISIVVAVVIVLALIAAFG